MLRSLRESVETATSPITPCTNPYWPRSGDRGSVSNGEELLAHEVAELDVERGTVRAVDDGERLGQERRAQHGRILEQCALLDRQRIESRCDERVQRLGDLERGRARPSTR